MSRSISLLSKAFSALPLSSRAYGAIAFAIAPLMVIFVNVAAPRPAFSQLAEKKAERFALYVPQRANLVFSDGDLPPMLELDRFGLRKAAATFADKPAAPPLPTMRGRRSWRQLADAPCRVLRRICAVPELQAILRALRGKERPAPALMREPIVGTASTYNPFVEPFSGDKETASGEIYDAEAWTAAIQIDLRGRFGGVRYGRNYREVYALLESADKRAIVKINDVGPLRPGRIVDLSDRAMRHFDPTLERGLVPDMRDMRVTPLEGNDWMPGPVDDDAILTATALPPPERPLHARLAANVN